MITLILILEPVVQTPADVLMYDFPDNPDDVFYKVDVNYELEFSFIYDDEIEFHGTSSNCSMTYDQNDIHVDDKEILGQGKQI